MADSRKLASRIAVAGRWYRPGDDIPDDVAAKITNPKAWAADMDADPTVAEPGTSTGVRLASRVQVDGRWYGPDDEVPDAVAARIKNPKAWAGGMLPGAAGAKADTAAEPDQTPDSAITTAEAADEQVGGAGGEVAGDTGGDTPDRPRRSSTKRS